MVALSGLALSVAVLLFVQAVVAGFEREMRTRILGVVPHVSVYGRGPIADPQQLAAVARDLDGVSGAAEVITGPALVSKNMRVRGVSINGIDPGTYSQVSTLDGYVDDFELGEWQSGAFEILVGKQVAERLGLTVGDRVTVTLPEATVTPAGVFPRKKRFTVRGLVDTDSQLDARYVYVHIDDAARLFRLRDRAHAVQLKLDDPLDARVVSAELLSRLDGDHFVSTWFRQHGGLYGAIRVQKGMMLLLLSLLVAVAAFNLVSTLIMVVNERRGDVAILRTLGGGRGLIVSTFVVLGVAISAIGVALGVGAGFLLGYLAEAGFPWLEDALGIELMGEYLVHSLPVEYAAMDVVNVCIIAGALTLIATLYPALRAAALNPAEVLQHE